MFIQKFRNIQNDKRSLQGLDETMVIDCNNMLGSQCAAGVFRRCTLAEASI